MQAAQTLSDFQKIYLSAIPEDSTDPGQQGKRGSVLDLFAVLSSSILPKISLSTIEGMTSKGQPRGLQKVSRVLWYFEWGLVIQGTSKNFSNSLFRKKILTQANQRSSGEGLSL